jgi:hypothetical protein
VLLKLLKKCFFLFLKSVRTKTFDSILWCSHCVKQIRFCLIKTSAKTIDVGCLILHYKQCLLTNTVVRGVLSDGYLRLLSARHVIATTRHSTKVKVTAITTVKATVVWVNSSALSLFTVFTPFCASVFYKIIELKSQGKHILSRLF